MISCEGLDRRGRALTFGFGPLSVIGSHVRAANPEFDPRTYGCAKLVDLIEKTGQFQVKRNEIPVRARMKRLQ